LVDIRIATEGDFAAIDALFARSYPRLLAADYPPSILVTAIPLFARAKLGLVTSGTFYVAQIAGQIVGAGGWTATGPMGEQAPGVAHVRHFASDPDFVRRGVGSGILTTCFDAAMARKFRGMACYSTRTAVPFYEANGFSVKGEVEIPLRAGITFPAVAMVRRL